MPVEHSVDPHEHLIFSRAFDTLSDQDLLNQRRRLLAHPRFEPEFDQIFEFVQPLQVLLSSHGIALLADRRPLSAGSRRALVVPPSARADADVAQMLTLLEERYPDPLRATFDRVEAARQWLHVSSHEA